jgi:hypothetical protein
MLSTRLADAGVISPCSATVSASRSFGAAPAASLRIDRLVRVRKPDRSDVAGSTDTRASLASASTRRDGTLVAILDAHQDLDGFLLARRIDLDGLEAALERSILLDVLPVLGGRRRADAADLAARERRLEDVGGVERALPPSPARPACAARR